MLGTGPPAATLAAGQLAALKPFLPVHVPGLLLVILFGLMQISLPTARSLGYDAIGLHVFGDNDVARTLYRTSGYEETDVTMRKALY